MRIRFLLLYLLSLDSQTLPGRSTDNSQSQWKNSEFYFLKYLKKKDDLLFYFLLSPPFFADLKEETTGPIKLLICDTVSSSV